MVSSFLFICLIAFLVRKLLNRHTPQIGGRVGGCYARPTAVVLPAGFSSVTCRGITLFGARSDAAYPSLKAFLRHGTFQRAELMDVYRVADWNTLIEISVTLPNYDRIGATEALELLRELPDPRMVRRLHLSDEPSFLDPWLRQVSGRKLRHFAHANAAGLVVLYRPGRAERHELGITLLHEWLHLVAFKARRTLRRFKRASDIEPLVPLTIPTLASGARTLNDEAWCDLGERVLGPDEAAARQAALAAPLHSLILWQEIETIFRNVPKNLASTRLADLEARATFMHNEVARKAETKTN